MKAEAVFENDDGKSEQLTEEEKQILSERRRKGSEDFVKDKKEALALKLADMYWNDRLSLEQIAKRCGIPRSETIRKLFKRNSISRRSRREGIRLHNRSNSLTVSCDFCGASLRRPPSQTKHKHHFCSFPCKGAWTKSNNIRPWNFGFRVASATRICKGCGRFFISFKSENQVFCSSRCWRGCNQSDTRLERLMEWGLNKCHIRFEKQAKIGPYRADFLIDGRTVVECDGDYYHNLPQRIERDAERNWLMLNLGYSVLRFPEDRIRLHLEECLESIVNISQDKITR